MTTRQRQIILTSDYLKQIVIGTGFDNDIAAEIFTLYRRLLANTNCPMTGQIMEGSVDFERSQPYLSFSCILMPNEHFTVELSYLCDVTIPNGYRLAYVAYSREQFHQIFADWFQIHFHQTIDLTDRAIAGPETPIPIINPGHPQINKFISDWERERGESNTFLGMSTGIRLTSVIDGDSPPVIISPHYTGTLQVNAVRPQQDDDHLILDFTFTALHRDTLSDFIAFETSLRDGYTFRFLTGQDHFETLAMLLEEVLKQVAYDRYIRSLLMQQIPDLSQAALLHPTRANTEAVVFLKDNYGNQLRIKALPILIRINDNESFYLTFPIIEMAPANGDPDAMFNCVLSIPQLARLITVLRDAAFKWHNTLKNMGSDFDHV